MAQFEIKDGVAIIPDGTTEIGYDAFKGCTSLVAINVPAKRSRNYKWYLRPIVYDKVVELASEKETKK